VDQQRRRRSGGQRCARVAVSVGRTTRERRAGFTYVGRCVRGQCGLGQTGGAAGDALFALPKASLLFVRIEGACMTMDT